MANQSELTKRVITAVFGVSALLALILFGGKYGVSFLAAVLSIGMMYEFVDICYTLPDRVLKQRMMMGIAWLVAFVNFWVPRSEYELLIMVFLGLSVYFLYTVERHPDDTLATHYRELMYSIFGVVYLVFLPLYFPLIRDSANGIHWIVLFFLINWFADTGAYFAGKRFGKHKLYPLISPKKTMEGALGGLLMAALIAVVYKLLAFHSMSYVSAILVAVFVGIASQLGDLCESFLKRANNKKDSGALLPGHGGLLDRFDGVVFSLPVMYACIRTLG